MSLVALSACGGGGSSTTTSTTTSNSTVAGVATAAQVSVVTAK
jgi:hypothetical protein